MTNKPTQQEQVIKEIVCSICGNYDICHNHKAGDYNVCNINRARAIKAIAKLHSLNLLRTGEEVYLDPDQTTSKNPCDDCKFFIRNEGCRRPDSICWSRHFYNGQQELIDRGFKKVCVSPHKEEWKDKPYGEGWWDYWILFTEGMAKEYLGQYIYDGRYFLTKCGKGFNCSRTKYEDGCYIDGMSEGKWQKAIVPEGVEKDGKPNID